MRATVRCAAVLLFFIAGCATTPRLRATDAGCFAVQTDVPVPPFLGSPPPVLPGFVQLDDANLGQVLAPSRWALGAGPGQRSVSLSQFRPGVGLRGPDITAPREVGVLPPDSLVLYFADAIGGATVLLARDSAGWAGRVVRPGPPVVMTLRRMACPAEPMTIGPVRRPV
jgi:hypothetical protein